MDQNLQLLQPTRFHCRRITSMFDSCTMIGIPVVRFLSEYLRRREGISARPEKQLARTELTVCESRCSQY